MAPPPSLVAALLFALLLPIARSCYNHTLESCTLDDQCFSASRFCVAATLPDANGIYPACVPPYNAKGCVCSPPSLFAQLCATHADCPTFEACALPSLPLYGAPPGAAVCVGCRAMADAATAGGIKFTPIGDDAPAHCNAFPSRPPCGRSLNWCDATTLPCNAYHHCIDESFGFEYTCSRASAACYCRPKSVSFRPCASDADCGVRQACIESIFSARLMCLSCDVPELNPFYALRDPASVERCRLKRPRPIPRYIPGPNARLFDYCEDNSLCAPDTQCRRYSILGRPAAGFEPCPGDRSVLCFCHSIDNECTSATDCKPGEMCADIPLITVGRQCVTSVFIYSVPPNFFNFSTLPVPTPTPNADTLQSCHYDWDCTTPGDRCTHPADMFGGCAGRPSCTCESLSAPICAVDTNCPGTQRCVNYVDGRTRPFCVAKAVADKSTVLYAVMDSDIDAFNISDTVVGEGYTMDSCLTSADCTAPLKCLHVTEGEGIECDGSRRFCMCKRALNGVPGGCASQIECRVGELCVDIRGSIPVNGLCISSSYVLQFPDLYYKL